MGMKMNHLSCKLKEHDERRSLPNAYLVSRLPSGKQTTSPPWTPRVLSRSCIGDDGVYHLQEVSAKSGWKDNGTRLFGSFRRTMLEQRKIWKGTWSCFSSSISLKPSLIPVLAVRSRFSVDGADLYTDTVNAILPFPNFAYHLPKPLTDRFARVLVNNLY